MTLFMFSMCLMVTTCLSPRNSRAGIIQVATIAKPENTAPATKYGGKIVVCQPGISDVAKSKDTIVCTDSTSGVDRPAKRTYAHLYSAQWRPEPRHPSANTP